MEYLKFQSKKQVASFEQLREASFGEGNNIFVHCILGSKPVTIYGHWSNETSPLVAFEGYLKSEAEMNWGTEIEITFMGNGYTKAEQL